MLTAVPLLSVKAVVVALVIAVCQLLTKFETLTEPRPVAWSNPVVAANPVSLTKARFVLPDVTSLKMQVPAGGVVVFDASHATVAGGVCGWVAANLYSA
jgi:hypothetical protein